MMNESYSPRFNNMPFDDYRRFCDEHNFSSRKIGLLNDELKNKAQRDPKSIFTEVNDQFTPVIVPIDYVEGYDIDRSKELAKKAFNEDLETFFWCLPSVELSEQQTRQVAESVKHLGGIAVYVEYSDNDQTAVNNLNRLQELSESVFEKGAVVEPNAAPGYESPAMYMHEFIITSPHNTSSDKESVMSDHNSPIQVFDEEVEWGQKEKYPQNGIALYDGSQMRPDIQDKLWDMYQQRFQWLGANHPISMEDTKEEFIEAMSDPATWISISYENGEPACMGYLSEKPESFFWLNSEFIKSSSREGVKDMYFAGIVSSLESAANHGVAVLNEMGEALLKVKGMHRILFESTNLSEGYVPKITRKAIEKSGMLCLEEGLVDTTHYQLLKVQ